MKADLDVFNHNIETVPRLYTTVRPGARYFASLELLKNAKKFNKKVFTKSGIMVGLGEDKEEVIQVMDDLRSAKLILLLSVNIYNHLLNIIHLIVIIILMNLKNLSKLQRRKVFYLVSSSPLNEIFLPCR